ncbi:MAG: hypothetical protein WC586_04890 [Methanoregula sp.]
MGIKHEHMLWGICLVMAIITGWSILEGNETIFPTALVLTLITLVLSIDGTFERPETARTSSLGAAGRSTLVTFSVLVAVSSLLVSLYLPGYAEANNMSGWFDGDFVRVTINDFHELAYETAFLLLLAMAFLLYYQWRQPVMHRLGRLRDGRSA